MYISDETPALPLIGIMVSTTVNTVRMPPPC